MTVDLSTCEREPIHIPGAIQPHGVLLALDRDMTVRQVSANVLEMFDRPASSLLERHLPEEVLGRGVLARLADAVSSRRVELLNPIAVRDGALDGIVHESGPSLVVEIERPSASAHPPHLFAVASQEALGRLQGCHSLAQLLDTATSEIKRITGFDRVMAYRFAPDAHGEVVAEARAPDLDAYLGLHYPASDIPAQARRLYTLNPIRLIADVAYRPVPIVPNDSPITGAPLDLSFSVLRSVSPIHCEYLANMGVRASMSISLLVDGALWGLIACHHYAPMHVPFATRITAQLLGRTLSMMIEHLERAQRNEREQRALGVVRTLLQRCESAEDIPRGLTGGGATPLDLAEAEGLAVTIDSRVVTIGTTPPREWIVGLTEWLAERDHEVLATDDLASLYPPATDEVESACGLLAAPHHLARRGYVMLFRTEHRRQVDWAGNPNDKSVVTGPNGPRLTPRGSFELWRETVAGKSRPWDDTDVALLRGLAHQLTELQLRWASAQDAVRNLVVGMVGHDLRTPLHAISMAAELLRGGDSGSIATRISTSSQRMKSLVDALMDLSQMQSGQGLGLETIPTNLHQLVRRLVEEASLAYPGTAIDTDLGGDARVQCDPNRIEQVVANLISNARHHGDAARAVQVQVRDAPGDEVLVRVHNWGDPIPDDVRKHLFTAYQGTNVRRHRRSGGLGLGLFIARGIVVAHGGRIEVESTAEAGTEFRVFLPRRPPSG